MSPVKIKSIRPRKFRSVLRFAGLATAVLLLCGAVSAFAWTPGTGTPSAADGFSLDTSKRSEVLSFYNCVYNQSENYASNIDWTGSLSSPGNAGTTSGVFKEDVRRRVNFYRALTGVTADVAFSGTLSAMDQQAALVFVANVQLSHTLNSNWTYYTAAAGTAALNSNIGLGWGSSATASDVYGPAAIDGYMVDNGSENRPVGHRRWILYSQQQTMGTGDIPPTNITITSTAGSTTYENVSANALWINGPFKPAALIKGVPWPNSGYFPHPLMPARWSFTYPQADFTTGTVAMTSGTSSVGLTIVSNTDNGRGDNTIVWEPSGLPSSLTSDTTYTITVSGFKISGTPTSYSYNVTLFNPDVLGNSVTISGTSAPFVSGGTYTFNAIEGADAYQLRVANPSGAAWTEGAEDSPTPQITSTTTGTYSLRQTAFKHTGGKAFQLAFPSSSDYSNQSFIVTRNIVPSATSYLQFFYARRFITASTLLTVQISKDGGSTWADLWTSTGVNILDNGAWESFPSSTPNGNLSLAAYAGTSVQFRFVMRLVPDSNGSYYVPVTYNASNPTYLFEYFGVFIDDITVTNAVQLLNPKITTLSGTATSFSLNATTSGTALVSGTVYDLQIRPQVGLRWYEYGALKQVTAQALMSYSDWVTKLYPTVTGGASGDDNHNGITNGAEFAFGLNPITARSPAALPQPVFASGTLSATFTQPDGVTGVTYGAQWSTDLVNWTSIADTGTSPVHTFSVSTGTATRAFLRYQINLQ